MFGLFRKKRKPQNTKSARKVDAAAQNNLGNIYYSGQGVRQDYAQAIGWYREAAAQGHAEAQHNLGIMYEHGRGVRPDHAQAADWYRKASEQGYAIAQNNLGAMYYSGQGVRKDYAQAVDWTRRAAVQGVASAQFGLGRMYHNGQGVSLDHTQAADWYRKAAEQGFSDAQFALGLISQNDQAQKQIDDALKQMGASVVLITQSGKIVMVSDNLRNRPRDWLGGQVIEVMIKHPDLDPYFIYYENEDYYFRMTSKGSRLSISDFQKDQGAAKYRGNVSQTLCAYLILYLIRGEGKAIHHPRISFSHNRTHTNVIAYIEKLSNWYPVQHSSEEPESATVRKIAQVNRGELDITDIIAVHEPSPA